MELACCRDGVDASRVIASVLLRRNEHLKIIAAKRRVVQFRLGARQLRILVAAQ